MLSGDLGEPRLAPSISGITASGNADSGQVIGFAEGQSLNLRAPTPRR